jgi:pimeloyl-ACP methyl ester carboxylesterase
MPHISVGDIDLNVIDEGRGPVLLLVHGFPLDHTMWLGQIRHFSKTNRVIVPDLRGFGQSGVTTGTVTMQRYADDLARLLDAMRIQEPVCVCGLSMGGYIAFQFFQHHRRRLKSLILCDCRSVADDEAGKKNRENVATRVLKEGPDFLATALAEKLFAKKRLEAKDPIVTETQTLIRRTHPEGIAAASRGMAARPDVTGVLASIDVPTLVIVGEEDAISPAKEMRTIADGIPGARFAEIKRAGHMSPLEDPAAVNAAIEEFLKAG